MHSLKVESYVYSLGLLGLRVQEIASQGPLRDLFLRRLREESVYIIFPERAGNLNIQRLLFIKENQIAQVKEFSTFCVWGNARAWAN